MYSVKVLYMYMPFSFYLLKGSLIPIGSPEPSSAMAMQFCWHGDACGISAVECFHINRLAYFNHHRNKLYDNNIFFPNLKKKKKKKTIEK